MHNIKNQFPQGVIEVFFRTCNESFLQCVLWLFCGLNTNKALMQNHHKVMQTSTKRHKINRKWQTTTNQRHKKIQYICKETQNDWNEKQTAIKRLQRDTKWVQRETKEDKKLQNIYKEAQKHLRERQHYKTPQQHGNKKTKITTKRHKTAPCVSCSCPSNVVNTDFIIWICSRPLLHVKCVADNLSSFYLSCKAALCRASSFTQTPTAVCCLMTLLCPGQLFLFSSSSQTTGILVRAGITLLGLCYTAERFIAQQGNVSYCHRCCCLELFI